MRPTKPNTAALTALLLAAIAIPSRSAKPKPEVRCIPFSQHEIPTREAASAKALPKSDTCTSYAYYFGFGCPRDFAKAKAKAFQEREAKVDEPFRGSSLLTVVYANGTGGPRDIGLAMKFACEAGGAEAELEGRLDHLGNLAEDTSDHEGFSICDDITSGYMMGVCAAHGNMFHDIELQRKFGDITRGWPKAERDSFSRFHRVFEDYNRIHAGHETDMTGTARGAMYIEELERGQDSLVAALRRFEKGVFPKSTPDEFRRADSLLNRAYRRIQRDTATPLGTVRKEDIRATQRKWISYRDAWVRFARLKYPAWDPIAVQTWLTRTRTRELEGLAER